MSNFNERVSSCRLSDSPPATPVVHIWSRLEHHRGRFGFEIGTYLLLAVALAPAFGCRCPGGDDGNHATAVATSHPKSLDAGISALPAASKLTATSLVQLLANPGHFDGARVAVAGYLVMDDMESEVAQGQLHLHREDALLMLGNHVTVSVGSCGREVRGAKPMDSGAIYAHTRRYVGIYGTFLAQGTESTETGVICSITRMADIREPPKEWVDRVVGAESQKRLSKDAGK